MPDAINPLEWIEIGRVAVRTRSVDVAARVAARISDRVQRLPRDAMGIDFETGADLGVEFMALARFHEQVMAQRRRAAIDAAAEGYARDEHGRPIDFGGAQLFFVLDDEDDDL